MNSNENKGNREGVEEDLKKERPGFKSRRGHKKEEKTEKGRSLETMEKEIKKDSWKNVLIKHQQKWFEVGLMTGMLLVLVAFAPILIISNLITTYLFLWDRVIALAILFFTTVFFYVPFLIRYLFGKILELSIVFVTNMKKRGRLD